MDKISTERLEELADFAERTGSEEVWAPIEAITELIASRTSPEPGEWQGQFDGPIPPHWSTDEGTEKANEYVTMSRSDLAMGDKTDFELANAVYLVGRESISLLSFQTAAKERIRWLSAQLAASTIRAASIPTQPGVRGLAEALHHQIDEYWRIAWREGSEGRIHDNEDNEASRVRAEIDRLISALTPASTNNAMGADWIANMSDEEFNRDRSDENPNVGKTNDDEAAFIASTNGGEVTPVGYVSRKGLDYLMSGQINGAASVEPIKTRTATIPLYTSPPTVPGEVTDEMANAAIARSKQKDLDLLTNTEAMRQIITAALIKAGE